MKKLLVANWKLHPNTKPEALKILKASDHKNVVVCPPFPFLDFARSHLKNAELGAQDLFWEEKGPYTGEVSPAMVKSFGARYVILGHSERRHWQEESDLVINKKVMVSLWAGLKIILCVGEPLSIRKRGIVAAKKFVAQQLKKDLQWIKRRDIIVAYEPIWAIGTGKADNPKESAEMAAFIKKMLGKKAKVLYGGSVNSKNINSFLRHHEIDGALVGGASLKPGEFRKMIQKLFSL